MTAQCLMEWAMASGVPLLAVVVSGVSVLAVSVFSWWQMRIAREKLRHDLYDRRFAIYMAFHELLVAVVEKDNVDAELRKAIAAWDTVRSCLIPNWVITWWSCIKRLFVSLHNPSSSVIWVLLPLRVFNWQQNLDQTSWFSAAS